MRTLSKELHFPLGGVDCGASIRDSHDSPTRGVYTTPFALNVRPRCVFEKRNRGGSRPGLVAIDIIDEPQQDSWVWPNGQKVLWADGSKILTGSTSVENTPDGLHIVNPHDIPQILPTEAVGAPTNATIGIFYRARLVLVEESGNIVYFSRTSDISDWDYGADRDDLDKAVAISIGKADVKGDKITCLATIDDSRLFICTARETYVLSGNPVDGDITRVSAKYGCISPNAWAYDGSAMYLLSSAGLIRIAQGEAPVEISYAIPDALHGLKGPAVCIYDVEENGIHIFTDFSSWFFSMDGGTWWEQSYGVNTSGSMALARINDNGIDTVAFGIDNEWYKQSRGEAFDDGIPFFSSVALGPIKLTDGVTDAILAEVAIYAAKNYGDSTSIYVYMGKTAESAKDKMFSGNYDYSFNAKDGFNGTWRPRTRGAWCVILMGNDKPWAYEYGQIKIKQLGRLR